MAEAVEVGVEKKRPVSGEDRRLQVVVVTPERTALEQEADFVALPLHDGELGVLPGRAPAIGRLGYGELRTKTGETTRRYFVDGGFVQIRDDVVTVLTSRAIAAEKIDAAAATQELQKAEHLRAVTPEELAAKTRGVARARAMLRVKAH
ncbi:ATP synthase epsilon chain [Aquisphaera giovannonii]|uniref:ATP synthase epsilon chain n=1 Tax=Aquisphaera giovannonii TaxID=406548 RepID=A0A5B9W0K8_9BACT|nr:ATP synthase F1 subunit epsilon [Aquisphaera giovannonii]QEH34073.1 ATP synthase epsilon chain [Aquisphaera giovannonii]